jgi:hypothetical protein
MVRLLRLAEADEACGHDKSGENREDDDTNKDGVLMRMLKCLLGL